MKGIDLLKMLNWLKKKKSHRSGAVKKQDHGAQNPDGGVTRIGESNQKEKSTVYAKIKQNMVIVPSNYQHRGARERQEDAFAISYLEDQELVKQKGVLAVVADGMGGLSVGEEASQVAVEIFFKEFYLTPPEASVRQGLSRAMKVANSAVFDLALKDGEVVDMGTTLTAALIYGDTLYWVSAGDSRIYHFKDGDLSQLTRDHVYANELKEDVINGRITREEAEKHPERDYLTSYLGLFEVPEMDLGQELLPLNPGDAVMICSDGLYNALTVQEMAGIIRNGSIHAAEQLVKTALSKNLTYQDNITVVVFSCQPVE